VPHDDHLIPDFVSWPTFPFHGTLHIKPIEPPTDEPPRQGEAGGEDCAACGAPDSAYVWVSDRWRVKAPADPSGLPVVLILESRSHLDLGDLPNLLAAELGVMTVRLERAVRSLPGVACVHVNRWGDGASHLHVWFFARPAGQPQLRGSFLTMWKDILPPISEERWRTNLALVGAWLADFGGRAMVDPPRIAWQSLTDLPPAETASAVNGIVDAGTHGGADSTEKADAAGE
jgi:diadenosine tetraphosphate (Ap4A) HIT family hydrolase